MLRTNWFAWLITGSGNLFSKSLSDLEKELDPSQFFRINRKYLVSINAVKKIRSCGKGKLLVELAPAVEEEIVISNETVAGFKEWMDR